MSQRMNVIGVVGVAMVASWFGCCCLSAVIGQMTPAEQDRMIRRAASTEEVLPGSAQADVQTEPYEAPAPAPRVPGWQNPRRVAGAEAGMAVGLTYERIFELGYQVWEAGQRGEADPVLAVAQAETMEAGRVEDAMVTYGENRAAMKTALESSGLGRGVVGRVHVEAVLPDTLGPFTASVLLTIYGCPGGTDLDFLAETAAAKVATNLTRHASGYRGAIQYEGLRCDSGRYGSVRYDAETGRVVIGE